MPDWSSSPTLWADLLPALFPPSRVAAADAEVDAIVRLAGLAPPQRILDLPCGVGRHTFALRRRGFRVTGVDATPAFLPAGDDFVLGDMRTFRDAEPYDAVLNLWTAFGYFPDEADQLATLRTFHQALRPGGVLVMELNGKEVLARTYRSRDWTPIDGGGWLLEERRIRDGWTWVDSHWTFIRADGRVIEHDISVRCYAASELRTMLHAAGFAEVRVHGALDGCPYDENAKRLVVVARR
jgi:SAM-dependent methyltransferase